MPRIPVIGVWRNDDGTCSFTQFFTEGKDRNETEQNYIERSIESVRTDKTNNFKDKLFFLIPEAEYRAMIDASPQKSKRALRIDDKGVLSFDANYVPEEVTRRALKESARTKLLGMNLTADEVKVILREK